MHSGNHVLLNPTFAWSDTSYRNSCVPHPPTAESSRVRNSVETGKDGHSKSDAAPGQSQTTVFGLETNHGYTLCE